MTWARNLFDRGGLYTIWASPLGGFCVVDGHGTNVLHATDGSGRVLADRETCAVLAAEWNR